MHALHLAKWNNNSVPHGRCFVFGNLLFLKEYAWKAFWMTFCSYITWCQWCVWYCQLPTLLGTGTWWTLIAHFYWNVTLLLNICEFGLGGWPFRLPAVPNAYCICSPYSKPGSQLGMQVAFIIPSRLTFFTSLFSGSSQYLIWRWYHSFFVVCKWHRNLCCESVHGVKEYFI